MKFTRLVSFWYTPVLLVFAVSQFAIAADEPGKPPAKPVGSSGGSVVTTGYVDEKGNQAQGAGTGTGALPSGNPMSIRYVAPQVPSTNQAHPNLSQELAVRASNPKDNTGALEILKSLANFGTKKEDTPYSIRSRWQMIDEKDPDAAGYLYKPVDNYENLPEKQNNFPQLCNASGAISEEEVRVLAAKLSGKPCVPKEDSLYCMVCNLYHEARGETDDGQIGVVRNVMTRVFNDAFPDTVCKVVWQRNDKGTAQYSWTNDHIPNNLTYNHTQLERLIRNSAKGMCLGPSGYSNYYAHGTVFPRWGGGACAKTKNVIGNHTFCSADYGGKLAPQTRTVQQVRTAEMRLSGHSYLGGDTSNTPAIK